MRRSRVTLATIDAAAIDSEMLSPLTIVRAGHGRGGFRANRLKHLRGFPFQVAEFQVLGHARHDEVRVFGEQP